MKTTNVVIWGTLLLFARPLWAGDITLQPNTTHQTITGWELVAYADETSSAFATYAPELFDRAVNEAGINRVRLEIRSGAENDKDYFALRQAGSISNAEYRCHMYSTVNDNSDPNTQNAGGFHFSEMDQVIDRLVIPMRQRLKARGESLYINLNYVAFLVELTKSGCSSTLQYNHDDSPEEYAEFILATFLHMQSKYGFTPDSVEVILEADNPDTGPFWRGKTIGNAVVAAAKRLAANGFHPRFIVPSCMAMSQSGPYFADLATQVPEALPYISELSYHRYTGVSATALQQIADLAVKNHLMGAAMLEWWSSKNTYQVLHEDLTTGRNTAWQQGAFVDAATGPGLYVVDTANPSAPLRFTTISKYTIHYYRHVRRDAVRLGATSNNSNDKVVAFRNTDGKHVVVGYDTVAGGAFTVSGLPAGTYGIFYSATNDPNQVHRTLTDVSVTAGQKLTFTLPFAAVFTIYAKAGSTMNVCDENRSGTIDVVDVQRCVLQAINQNLCGTADINQDGQCTVVDVQRVVNAALGKACNTAP
jgi:hypothetical protein